MAREITFAMAKNSGAAATIPPHATFMTMNGLTSTFGNMAVSVVPVARTAVIAVPRAVTLVAPLSLKVHAADDRNALTRICHRTSVRSARPARPRRARRSVR